jgi:hypothetical protein
MYRAFGSQLCGVSRDDGENPEFDVLASVTITPGTVFDTLGGRR